MTNADQSSPNSPTHFEAVVKNTLEKSPLLPLTLGILATSEEASMPPSKIQEFIIDAVQDEHDSEDGDHEATHDTSEILIACADMQQAGLVMVSKAESDAEPQVTLTDFGQNIGVPVAHELMKDFIAQGHGLSSVERKTPARDPNIIGKIALGAVGLVAKVAEALDDGTQQISEEVRKLVENAIRNRPSALPPAPRAPKPVGTPPDGSWSGWSTTGKDAPFSNPPTPQPEVNKARSMPETSKFTSKIVQPSLKLKLYGGVGLRLPPELDRELYPQSDIHDRPAMPTKKTSSSPDGPESPQPASGEGTPESEKSTKPDTPSSSGQKPNTSAPDSSRATGGGENSSGNIPTADRAGSAHDDTEEESEEEHDDQKEQSEQTPKEQDKQPQPEAKGGTSGGGGGQGGSGGATNRLAGSSSGGGGGSSTGGGQSSIEDVQAGLSSVVNVTEGLIARLQLAYNNAEEAVNMLRMSRSMAALASLPGMYNPLELGPEDLTFLAKASGEASETAIARMQHAAREILDALRAYGNSGNGLAASVQKLSDDM